MISIMNDGCVCANCGGYGYGEILREDDFEPITINCRGCGGTGIFRERQITIKKYKIPKTFNGDRVPKWVKNAIDMSVWITETKWKTVTEN